MFKDRIDAGRQLALKLKKYKGEPGVILAVPRGGVPVGYMITIELGFPLDIILARKIGHPMQKEYAIGAASLTDFFVTPHPDIPDGYVESELLAIRTRLKEMYKKFMGDKTPESLEGKTVIVVDDGMATGSTLLGTIKILRKSKARKIIVAVPVASKDAVQKLSGEVDEVVSILVPDQFYGVGAFYENFKEVCDEEVIFYLDKLKKAVKPGQYVKRKLVNLL
jgi:putative phosphoribosyl transferase